MNIINVNYIAIGVTVTGLISTIIFGVFVANDVATDFLITTFILLFQLCYRSY